ncbi:hypothetical protein DAPPUDRAFT_305939 [Daphnia pulex]|uniref:Uncharacterized protein n=1 Tax=Daphnia pulex TaxID=6669 RepID=E9I479_DAPPU|nr:hypothetical protein DAPPUDRAFT_305939 [Daphnia pulex]|eukprot:EFX61202.1 hypothetical protein DAPPUDRAFT_305939 [Daphnia pulex]
MFLRFLVAFFMLYVGHNNVLGAGMSYVNVAYPHSINALTCETDAAPVDNSTNALSDNEVDARKFTNVGLQFKKLEVSVSEEASSVEKSVKTDVKYQVKSDSIPLNSQDSFQSSFLGRLFRAQK